MKFEVCSTYSFPLILSLFIFLPQANVLTQTIFNPAQDELIKDASSGVAVGVTDINGDQLDDILRWDNAHKLQILLQLPSGEFKLHYQSEPTLTDIWNVTAYDINRDGWGDVIASGNLTGVHYYMSDANGNYTHTHDDRYQFLAQASNIVDINFDGMPDVFVCNDVGKNIMLKGEVNIPYQNEDLIPFDFPNTGDYAGNYGSVWEDINGDGLPDLYVSKCFHDATEPSDPRRINQLFLTNPDSSYTEMAHQIGVADSAQSWSSTFADVDNDGDWDLMVLNHNAPVHLFYNDNGQFRKSNDFAGEPLQLTSSVQVIAADFNNDAWIDFLITGEPAALIMNNGDGSFANKSGQLGQFRNEIITAAAGDLNNDGYIDLFTARHGLYNNPQGLSDQLLLNEGGEQHFVKLQLVDSNARLDGLHAQCRIFTNDGIQMRSLRVGDAYGITNSSTFHFGLGAHDQIDSMHVLWPDGTQEPFYDIAADQYYYLSKNGNLHNFADNELSRDVLCMGDTAILTIPDTLENAFIYHYESGTYDSSAQQLIAEAGNYYWQGLTTKGTVIRSTPFYMPYNPLPGHEINYSGRVDLCYGDSILLQIETEDIPRWNDGYAARERWVSGNGIYVAIVEGACGIYRTDTVYITEYPEVPLEVQNDTVVAGQDALLLASGDSLLWYRTVDGTEPVHFDDSLLIENVVNDTSFWVESYTVHEKYRVDSLGEVRHEGGSKYNGDFIDGALNFQVERDCELISVEVETEIPGPRAVQLIRNTQLLRIDTFELDSGKSTLSLNWSLREGMSYTIKTDRGLNFDQFQTYSPKLFRSSGDLVNYPYTDGKYIKITSSNYSDREYFYFYNWKVKGAPDTCYSERKEVKAVIDRNTASQDIFDRPLTIHPNPAGEIIYIANVAKGEGAIHIFNSAGSMIHKSIKSAGTTIRFNVRHLHSGLYFIHIQVDGQSYSGTFFKVN